MNSVRVRLDADNHILAIDLWFERQIGRRTVSHHIAAGARSCKGPMAQADPGLGFSKTHDENCVVRRT